MEVLEPSKRTIRLQRESAISAAASAQAGRERRTGRDRRSTSDRRKQQLPYMVPNAGPPVAIADLATAGTEKPAYRLTAESCSSARSSE